MSVPLGAEGAGATVASAASTTALLSVAKRATPPALPPRPRHQPGLADHRLDGRDGEDDTACRSRGLRRTCWPCGGGSGDNSGRGDGGGAGGGAGGGGGPNNSGPNTVGCTLHKYAFLCTTFGGLSALLGLLFLVVHFLVRSYTASLAYFETVPTYVPAVVLLATGLTVICLARRKNRQFHLMKSCMAACVLSAVLCVTVTVATTVVHMNRLQTLHDCRYTIETRTCTCSSELLTQTPKPVKLEAPRYTFNSMYDCDDIHGALYACLRVMFGLSVVGILVCIFSGMIVYQLLSHEKKKMYWEQLELRCRYLYRRPPSAGIVGNGLGMGFMGAPPPGATLLHGAHRCACCEDCRATAAAAAAAAAAGATHPLSPWDLVDTRYWAPGRVGNLYSPSPEERNQTPATTSGWNWPRLPWTRNTSNGGCTRPRTTSSPDNQYGFGGPDSTDPPVGIDVFNQPLGHGPAGGPYLLSQVYPTPQPLPRPFGAPPIGMPLQMPYHLQLPLGMDELSPHHFYVWGPPPPYMSDSPSNSPARRPSVPTAAPSPATSTTSAPTATTTQATAKTSSAVSHSRQASHLRPYDQTHADALVQTSLPMESGQPAGPAESAHTHEKSTTRRKRKKPSPADVSAAPIPQEPPSQVTPADGGRALTPASPSPPQHRRTPKRHTDTYPTYNNHLVQIHTDSDGVDTEGYSYPRLKFTGPEAPASTTPKPEADGESRQAESPESNSQPPYQLHLIESEFCRSRPSTRSRQPAPLPTPPTSDGYLGPEAQYESISDRNLYSYIAAQPRNVSSNRRTASSDQTDSSSNSATPNVRTERIMNV